MGILSGENLQLLQGLFSVDVSRVLENVCMYCVHIQMENCRNNVDAEAFIWCHTPLC
jgi:hypothetical protein